MIVLQQKEHELFRRSGEDLYCAHSITLTESLCGFQFVLKHLDGRDIIIKHPPGQVVEPGMFLLTVSLETYVNIPYLKAKACKYDQMSLGQAFLLFWVVHDNVILFVSGKSSKASRTLRTYSGTEHKFHEKKFWSVSYMNS